MTLPIVAVVGRPNVGKSTFVNRMIQAQDAIVHPQSGVTRDRSYHRADWNGREFMLVDTGGIEFSTEDAFGDSIRKQAVVAAQEADIVIFLVDGTATYNRYFHIATLTNLAHGFASLRRVQDIRAALEGE